ncbi:MAG: nucleotide exchange factor GrpE [Candidatus Bathyarchaeota archaeon]|jgi:molecular chaperone GrpE
MLKKKQKAPYKQMQVSSEESTKKEDFEEKVKRLEAKFCVEQEKTKEYFNRLKYLQADFENYKKRVEKEVQEAILRSNEKLVTRLIEIIDDLDSAISAGETTENKDALLDGIKIVQKKLDKILETEGLTRLETVGKPFDPNMHEILDKIPTKNHKHGTVLEEARKGFMFKGKVLRPSIVKIACENSKGEKNE